MTAKKIVISIVVGLAIGSLSALAFYQIKKRRSGTTNSSDQDLGKYDPVSQQVMQSLKKDIQSVETVLATLKRNDKGEIVYVSSGEKVNDQLIRATWIQIDKRYLTILGTFTYVSTDLPSSVKMEGKTWLNKLKSDIEAIFPVNEFNYQTVWFKEYQQK
jgi:hypothetical protein